MGRRGRPLAMPPPVKGLMPPMAQSDADARDYVTPRFAVLAPLLVRLERPEALEALGISRTDARIIEAFFRGDGEKQAAARLGLSRRALHARLERLYPRLGVHSRTEMIMTILATLLSEPIRRDPGPTNAAGLDSRWSHQRGPRPQ